jgi:hypothetical protein
MSTICIHRLGREYFSLVGDGIFAPSPEIRHESLLVDDVPGVGRRGYSGNSCRGRGCRSRADRACFEGPWNATSCGWGKARCSRNSAAGGWRKARCKVIDWPWAQYQSLQCAIVCREGEAPERSRGTDIECGHESGRSTNLQPSDPTGEKRPRSRYARRRHSVIAAARLGSSAGKIYLSSVRVLRSPPKIANL